MIISGGTATFGMTVSNSPTAAYSLNYTLAQRFKAAAQRWGR